LTIIFNLLSNDNKFELLVIHSVSNTINLKFIKLHIDLTLFGVDRSTMKLFNENYTYIYK